MHPMLTDFGIARLADSPGLTRTHEFVGTPAYVAPESAEGRPQTSAVDIYGAGILLYELVTGRPPFAGGSALEVLHQHLSAEPRRPSTVPDPLWTVIERCLRKNPDERPSAENLARGLRAVAEGVGVHANSAQIAAAEGVGALLVPDPAPAPVPDAPGRGRPDPGAAAAARAAYDPNAATSVMPHTGGPGAADPTAVLPTGARPTRPPSCRRSPGRPATRRAAARRPEDPHPWQNQLRAARDRNEQTQVQYLDPNQDPLRRRPQRQVSRPQQRPAAAASSSARHGTRSRSSSQPQQQQPQQYAPAPAAPAAAAAVRAPAAQPPQQQPRARAPRSRGSAAPTRCGSRVWAASRAACSRSSSCSWRAG